MIAVSIRHPKILKCLLTELFSKPFQLPHSLKPINIFNIYVHAPSRVSSFYLPISDSYFPLIFTITLSALIRFDFL